MANNIREKNLIYSLEQRSTLPYANVKTIDFSEQNGYINSPSLNNTYQQLTSNDDYIAHRLLSMKDKATGPVLVDQDDPNSQIYEMEDGAKFFMTLHDAKVYKKIDKPLQQSIQKFSDISNPVTNVFYVQPDWVLACINGKTYVDSCKRIESSKDNKSSFTEVKCKQFYDDDQGYSIALLHKCDGDVVYLDDVFIGKQSGSTANGSEIYKIVSEKKSKNQYEHYAVSMYSTAKEITCIAYRQQDNMLFFAEDDGNKSILYSCLMSNGRMSFDQVKQIVQFEHKTINRIMFAIADNGASRIAVFFSDGTIEWSSLGATAQYSTVSLDGISYVNDYCQLSDNIALLATSNGLYVQSDNGLSQLDSKVGAACIEVISTSIDSSSISLRIGYDDGTLCSFNYANGEMSENASRQIGSSIKSLQTINGSTLIATANGLKAQNSDGTINVVDGSLSCSSMVQNLVGSPYAYVVGKNNSGPFFKVLSVGNPVDVKSSTVVGLSSVYSSCNFDISFNNTQFIYNEICGVTQLNGVQCIVAKGTAQQVDDNDEYVDVGNYVALMNAIGQDVLSDMMSCTTLAYVSADQYHGIVDGNSIIGIVNGSVDGSNSIDIHSKYANDDQEKRYSFDDESFGELSSCKISDGLIVKSGTINDISAIAMKANDSDSTFMYASMSDNKVNNLLSCKLGHSLDDIIKVNGIVYALSSNGSSKKLIAFDSAEKCSLDDYSSDNLIAASDYALSTLPLQTMKLVPGGQLMYKQENFKYCLATGGELSSTTRYVAERVDYIVDQSGISSVSSLMCKTNGGINLAFEPYFTAIESFGNAYQIKDIKFVPEWMQHRPFALLLPSTSIAQLSVVSLLSGDALGNLDEQYFTSCVVKQPSIIFDSAYLSACIGNSSVVDAVVENVSYDQVNDFLSAQVLYSTLSQKLVREMLSCISASSNEQRQMSVSCIESCDLLVNSIDIAYFGDRSYSLLVNGNSISAVNTQQDFSNIVSIGSFGSSICCIAAEYSNTSEEIEDMDTSLPFKNELSSEYQSIDLNDGFSTFQPLANYNPCSELKVCTNSDVYIASSIEHNVEWQHLEFTLHGSSQIQQAFELQYSPRTLHNMTYACNTLEHIDDEDYKPFLLVVGDGTLKKVSDSTYIVATQLDQLPNDGFGSLSSAISSLHRDQNGNAWMNMSNAIQNVSAFSTSHLMPIAIGNIASQYASATAVNYAYLDGDNAIVWCTSNDNKLSAMQFNYISQQQPIVHNYGINADVAYVSEDMSKRYPCILSATNTGIAPTLYTFKYGKDGISSNVEVVYEVSALPVEVKKIVNVDGSDDVLLVADSAIHPCLSAYYHDNDNISNSYIEEFWPYTKTSFAFAFNSYDAQHYAFMYDQAQQLYAIKDFNRPSTVMHFFSGSGIGSYVRKPGFRIDYLVPIDDGDDQQYKVYMSYLDGNSRKAEEVTVYGINSYGIVFGESNSKLVGSNAINAILQIDSRKCAIGTSNGIFNYQYELPDELSVADHCYKVLDASNGIQAMQTVYDRGIPMYIATSSDILLSSATGMWWMKYADIKPYSGSSGQIVCYTQTDPYTLFAGKQTGADKGLYFSRYEYDIIDDTFEFTSESAMAVYEQGKPSVSAAISAALSMHIDELHGENSPAALLNQYMPVTFPLSNFTQERWRTSSGLSSLSNDYIERILEGNGFSEEVKAYAENTTMSKGRTKLALKYIAKQWKSGLVELYIYLPTTYTYYIPHVSGLCGADTGALTVNNMPVQPEVASNATHIRLNILSTYFEMPYVFENTIKGNSLPLKIFKEPSLATSEGPVANMYHSYIEPSVASIISTSTTTFDYYTADYWCFGSDAQAIKIEFDSSSKNFLKKYKTIVYHSGDENWKQPILQTDQVEQRFLEGASAKSLHWEIFAAENGMFLGWSTDPKATVPMDEYKEGKKFSYNTINQNILHLYAVWIFYAFDENDTTIAINNNGEQTYTIAELTIDPTITFNSTSKSDLGNRLVVKFDDDE